MHRLGINNRFHRVFNFSHQAHPRASDPQNISAPHLLWRGLHKGQVLVAPTAHGPPPRSYHPEAPDCPSTRPPTGKSSQPLAPVSHSTCAWLHRVVGLHRTP